MNWDDMNARARGLDSRRLGRAILVELARTADAEGTVRRVAESPLLSRDHPVTTATLDATTRRIAARQYAIIARRSGPRHRALRVLFLDEDRRSIRALLRGALAGEAPESRVAGLVPTPTLPEPALARLADATSVGHVTRGLEGIRHPWAARLDERVGTEPFDVFAAEIEIDRAFADDVLTPTRRDGPAVRDFIADAIDAENARSVLVLAGARSFGIDAASMFVPGGARLARPDYIRIVAMDAVRAAGVLTRLLLGNASITAMSAASFERAFLRMRVRRQIRRAREDPDGPAPVFSWALNLRAELVDIRLIAYARSLGVTAIAPDRLVSVR